MKMGTWYPLNTGSNAGTVVAQSEPNDFKHTKKKGAL